MSKQNLIEARVSGLAQTIVLQQDCLSILVFDCHLNLSNFSIHSALFSCVLVTTHELLQPVKSVLLTLQAQNRQFKASYQTNGRRDMESEGKHLADFISSLTYLFADLCQVLCSWSKVLSS